MSVLLKTVILLIAIDSSYCESEVEPGIPQSEINFTLFDKQPNSFVPQILDALTTRKNFWAKSEVAGTTKVVSAIGRKVPGLSPIATALPALQSLLADESDWKEPLAIAIPKVSQQIDARNELSAIINTDMPSLRTNFKILNTTHLQYDRCIANDIHMKLTEVLTKFSKGDSLFRVNPSSVVPALFALTLFVDDFMPLLQKHAIDIANKTLLACRMAETLVEYFHPVLLHRLSDIEMVVDYPMHTQRNKRIYQANIMKKGFNHDGSGWPEMNRDYIQCINGTDGDSGYAKLRNEIEDPKLTIKSFGTPSSIFVTVSTIDPNYAGVGYSILRDFLGPTGTYYRDDDGNCSRDYFQLVRFRLETAFGEAYKIANHHCKEEFRNREVPLSGKGWLTVEIGDLLVNRHCDMFGPPFFGPDHKYCDPYIKLIINNGEFDEFKTDWADNQVGWHSFEKTYYSPKLPIDAKIRIEIWDYSGFRNYFDELIDFKEMDINTLVQTNLINETNSLLYLNSVWRNEIIEEDFIQLSAEELMRCSLSNK